MLSIKKETHTDTIFLLFFVFFATDLGLKIKEATHARACQMQFSKREKKSC
jgi:hypothetical protein